MTSRTKFFLTLQIYYYIVTALWIRAPTKRDRGMSNQAIISKKISRNRKPHAKHPGRLPPASIGRTNFPDSRPRRINNIREVHGETPWRKACPERTEGTCLQGPFISFAKLRPCLRSFGLPTVSSEHLARNRTVARDRASGTEAGMSFRFRRIGPEADYSNP